MFRIFLFILFLSPICVQAKDYQVKITVKNLPADAQPLLLSIYNGNMFVIDSLAGKNQDTLTFRIPENSAAGMYRAILGMPPYARFTNAQPIVFDFLFNKEEVEFTLDFSNPANTVEVIRSKENRIYFDFLKADALYYQKLALLEQVVMDYPDQDEFYRKALEFYQKAQQQRDKFIDKTYASHRNTLAGRIIKNQKIPYTNGKLNAAERDSVFRKEFLNQVDFSDTTLLYTNVYTDKLYSYMQMFMDQKASPRENEANCILALDEIVPRLDVNPVIQQHLLQFLITGFESMKMEEVLAHISSHYLQQCGGSQEIIKRRLAGYSRMAIGQKVPDFTLNDIQGIPFNLYDCIYPYTLILFWHTECNHCQNLMKALPNLCRQEFFEKNQVRIIGVSIDENKENWEKLSAEYPLEWVNTYAEGSFESPLANDYNLFATPSMFLIDHEHNIIAKPTTIEELEKNIRELQ